MAELSPLIETLENRWMRAWVNGVQVWNGVRLLGEPQGQRLQFDR